MSVNAETQALAAPGRTDVCRDGPGHPQIAISVDILGRQVK